MSIRYLANLTLGVAGGFLVVATQAFADTPVKWLAFAIAAGSTIVGLGMVAAIRDTLQRALGATVAILGAWTVVASLVFSLPTVAALAFASALGFVGLALIGLTAHELRTERVVHSLELGDQREREHTDLHEPIAA
jgi:hypothetical protein